MLNGYRTRRCITGAVLFLGLAVGALQAATPRYVFFFLGDGMGRNQVAAAERMATGADGKGGLRMTRLPVHGASTTGSRGGGVTDSAAAVTAFACGVKTANGTLGMDAAHTVSYKSIAEILRDTGGWKIGVITSVSLDHATPAGYYAAAGSRNSYTDIACQMAHSRFDFFGGGGIKGWSGGTKRDDVVAAALAAEGYDVRTTKAAIEALRAQPRDRVVCLGPRLQSGPSLPYAIDRAAIDPDGLTLADYVRTAIACLQEAPAFLLVVEGGKIDWACHNNDAATAVGEVLDFDAAIGVALTFMTAHPEETLIVVTADHETGGMRLAPHSDADAGTQLRELQRQKVSVEQFDAAAWPAYRNAHRTGFDATTGNVADEADGAFMTLMAEYFGLTYAELDDNQRQLVEHAYDRSMGGTPASLVETVAALYGRPGSISTALAALVAAKAGIAWTSKGHTGVPVPVYAAGAGADRFVGEYDNTAIPAMILHAVGLTDIALPVAESEGAKAAK